MRFFLPKALKARRRWKSELSCFFDGGIRGTFATRTPSQFFRSFLSFFLLLTTTKPPPTTGSRHSQLPRALPKAPAHPTARDPRGIGDLDGRRRGWSLFLLSGAARQLARPVQGRVPLLARVVDGRDARARFADDLEDGAPRHPLWRREGRDQRRPFEALRRRARAPHAQAGSEFKKPDRPFQGRARSGDLYGEPRDELDL